MLSSMHKALYITYISHVKSIAGNKAIYIQVVHTFILSFIYSTDIL